MSNLDELKSQYKTTGETLKEAEAALAQLRGRENGAGAALERARYVAGIGSNFAGALDWTHEAHTERSRASEDPDLAITALLAAGEAEKTMSQVKTAWLNAEQGAISARNAHEAVKRAIVQHASGGADLDQQNQTIEDRFMDRAFAQARGQFQKIPRRA